MSSSAPRVPRYPVLADALAGSPVRDAVLVFAGAALTALCAQISIHVPPSPVPFTGQTFAVVMAGARLGARRGGASQLLYVLAGLALPIYADASSGWHTLGGPAAATSSRSRSRRGRSAGWPSRAAIATCSPRLPATWSGS